MFMTRPRLLRSSRHAATVLAAVSFALAPGTAAADCTGTPFAAQVHEAAVIFAGTLDHIRVEHSTEFAGSISLLRFRKIAYAKGGGSPESLVVTQPGVVGLMEDWPSFDRGVRYIAFATQAAQRSGRGWKPSLMAMSCTSFHPFDVRTDSTGREVVRDDLGRPVVAVGRDRIVLLARRTWDPEWPWVERDIAGKPIKPRFAGSWTEGAFSVQVLWPEDDPGTRVNEVDLLAWLHGIADGLASAPDSSRTQ
jgi:hypothetical protein